MLPWLSVGSFFLALNKTSNNATPDLFIAADAAGPNLRLSNGGLTVTNGANKQWNAVRATGGWNTGTHYWEVHIDKSVLRIPLLALIFATPPPLPHTHAHLVPRLTRDAFAIGASRRTCSWA